METNNSEAPEGMQPHASHGDGPRRRPSIGKINRGIPSSRCSEQPSDQVARGFEEFNRGEYFEQHETLEDAWIAEADPVRYLYQGILQVGVSLYHLQRGNLYGAERLMTRGLLLLESYRPACLGVDVDRFIEDAGRCLEAVRGTTPESLDRFDRLLFPRVTFCP